MLLSLVTTGTEIILTEDCTPLTRLEWWDSDLTKLSPQARAVCEDRANVVLLRVANAREMQSKLQPSAWWQSLRQVSFSVNSSATCGGILYLEENDMSQRHSDHAQDHTDIPSDLALRVKALESLLVDKGLVDPAALDVLVDTYENKVGPRHGARVVARAWVDPAYKQRLLEDGTAAIAEFGFSGGQGEKLTVVENTSSVHNVIVCTLCSCYPWPVLGLPPTWYKASAYRSRTVIDPRGMLRELGLDLPHDVEVRVWDSNAASRYLVLPERPQGTEAMNEADLAALVTRDAMIGVAKVLSPRVGGGA